MVKYRMRRDSIAQNRRKEGDNEISFFCFEREKERKREKEGTKV